MSEIMVQIRDNGPLLLQKPFKLVDAAGNAYPLDPNEPAASLCRCGASLSKPFCDGAHKTNGFQSVERAPVTA